MNKKEKDVKQLQEENKKLRHCLKFYSDRISYEDRGYRDEDKGGNKIWVSRYSILEDNGENARDTLIELKDTE